MAGVNDLGIKVGQVWRTRGGGAVTVVAHDSADSEYPWRTTTGDRGEIWVRNSGHEYLSRESNNDLIELVKDEETLSALGWTFDGQAWVEQPKIDMVPNALDVQVGGSHYKDLAIQPWAAFDSWLSTEQHVGYLLGTAIAYLARFNSKGAGKGGLVDVEKATHTLQRLVEVAKKGSANED